MSSAYCESKQFIALRTLILYIVNVIEKQIDKKKQGVVSNHFWKFKIWGLSYINTAKLCYD